MKPIRIFLPCNSLDAYVYSGHIFAVFQDGTLRTTPLSRVFRALCDTYPQFRGIFTLALLRSDWLLNPQATAYFYIKEGFEAIKNTWQKSALEDFRVELSEADDWTVLWEVPAMPVYDIRLYAMRVYLAHRQGVHEGQLRSGLDTIYHHNGLIKIFDARTINISARSGEFMLSADNEGLFHGSLWNEDAKTIVNQRPDAKKSLRTGWTGFDVINYEKHSYFSYMRNEIATRTIKPFSHSENEIATRAIRPFSYSEIDELPPKKEIIHVAVDTYSMDEVLQRVSFKSDDVQFCFNNSYASFFFLQDGRFLRVNWAKESEKDIRLRSRVHDLPTLKEDGEQKIVDKPCSAIIFPLGSVIEYFDKVIMVHNNKITELENSPVISIRTFPTSKRFKRLICITREDGIALHAIFPTEEEIFSLRSRRWRRTTHTVGTTTVAA